MGENTEESQRVTSNGIHCLTGEGVVGVGCDADTGDDKGQRVCVCLCVV